MYLELICKISSLFALLLQVTLYQSSNFVQHLSVCDHCDNIQKMISDSVSMCRFQVELQRAILRVVTRFLPRIQHWQKAANTQVVSVQQLVKWRSREILIVRIALVFAFVLLLLRAIRLVRLALRVVLPLANFLPN